MEYIDAISQEIAEMHQNVERMVESTLDGHALMTIVESADSPYGLPVTITNKRKHFSAGIHEDVYSIKLLSGTEIGVVFLERYRTNMVADIYLHNELFSVHIDIVRGETVNEIDMIMFAVGLHNCGIRLATAEEVQATKET